MMNYYSAKVLFNYHTAEKTVDKTGVVKPRPIGITVTDAWGASHNTYLELAEARQLADDILDKIGAIDAAQKRAVDKLQAHPTLDAAPVGSSIPSWTNGFYIKIAEDSWGYFAADHNRLSVPDSDLRILERRITSGEAVLRTPDGADADGADAEWDDAE